MHLRLVASLSALLVAIPALAAKKVPVPATPALATRLVEAVGVGAEDVVLVRTNDEALALAELVVAEVAKKGGTVVFEHQTPAILRSMLVDLPEGYLDRVPPYFLARLQSVNAIIELGPSDDPTVAVGVDPSRLIRARRGRASFLEKLYSADVRRVTLGSTAFPTDAVAKLYKADAGALAKQFWDAVEVKTALHDDRTTRLKKALSGLKVVNVETANGTNLELRLAARPLYANTGAVNDDVRTRQGMKEVTLPAGEVATVPTEFFASGTLVVDAFEFDGLIVRDLKLSFRDGKATLESGGDNFAVFKRAFEAASGDKSVIGAFSIGTNTASKPLKGSYYRSPEMDGVVTIGIGWNKDVGGFNQGGFSARFKLVDATVKVDGAPLVEKGKLLLK